VNLKKKISLIIALLFLVATTGCAKKEVPKEFVDSSKLMMPSLPTYQPGEYFFYDSGLSMIATASDDGLVEWKYGSGATSTGYANFLIPQLSWESNPDRSESTTDASPNFLWPLNVGKSGRFNITQTLIKNESSPPDEIKRTWECKVEGTEKVVVPAGKYDTYVVSCSRYSTDDKDWRGRHRYYYSPDIRHYVMVEKDYARRTSTIERLSKHGFNSNYLPQEDQITLKDELYQVLEKGQLGQAESWVSSSDQISAMLIPYQSFKGSREQQCREYRSIYNVGGRVHQHTRKACQAADGSWQKLDESK